jgi:DNA-binding transcriptional ArsR family regulator
MVQQMELDRTFAALSDGTRRDILSRLGSGPATLGELAAPAGMTLTGIAKHVQVLEAAGLVATRKVGRARECRLGAHGLEPALDWITHYQQLWERRLDGLELYFTLKNGTLQKGTEQ